MIEFCLVSWRCLLDRFRLQLRMSRSMMRLRMGMILRMMRCRRMMRMRMRRTRRRMMIFSQASQDVRVSCLTSMTCFRTLSQNQPPLAHRAALGAHRPCHHHQGIQGRHIDVGTARISSCPTPCTVARFRPNGIPLSGSLGSAIVFFPHRFHQPFIGLSQFFC